jgi:AcrR family transcriptional regulator
MSPRTYQLGLRQAAADRTRNRIIAAARELLGAGGGPVSFNVEAVARLAGVTRVTIYRHFASKLGLLEALYDDLGRRGLVARLTAAFQVPAPLDALAALIDAFCHFWESDRVVLRRLRGLAVVDPEVEQGLRARDARRREGLRAMMARLDARPAQGPLERAEILDVIFVLTSFETFDMLSWQERSAQQVTALVKKLVLAALGPDHGGIPPPAAGRTRGAIRHRADHPA